MARLLDVPQRLRDDIVAGTFPFGARIRIDELASRYGTSHMPVREALRELNGEGLVVMEPNRGARVRPIDRRFIENLFEIRGALEIMLARHAAQRRTPLHLAQMAEVERGLEDCIARGDYPAVLEANRRFHQAVNLAADNPEAGALVDRHWFLMAALWRRYGYGPERFAGVANDHQHLIRSLEARDADGAAVVMAAHVTKAKRELLDRMARHGVSTVTQGAEAVVA